MPLGWALTQHNLGNALLSLGQRETGTTRLEQAVAAFRAALQEQTRERVPLDWAAAMESLAMAEEALGNRTAAPSHWQSALATCEGALEEYRLAGAERDIATMLAIRDRLTAKLASGSKAIGSGK